MSDLKKPDFQAMADAAVAALEGKAPAGPPKCHVCNAAEVKHAGDACPPCAVADNARRWRERLDSAWHSLPEDRRRVKWDRVEAQVKDAAALEKIRHLAAMPTKELPAVVTFTGRPGAGKTTAATFVFLEHLRPAYHKDATPKAKEFGSRMRFAHSTNLARALDESSFGETPAAWETAYAATILLLDEFGRFAGGDRRTRFFDLLDTRINRGKPTIITTPILSASVAQAMGIDGGITRRVFTDAFRVDLPGGEWRPAGQT